MGQSNRSKAAKEIKTLLEHPRRSERASRAGSYEWMYSLIGSIDFSRVPYLVQVQLTACFMRRSRVKLQERSGLCIHVHLQACVC